VSSRWPSVVFDLDGTLVDTIGLIIDSYQHAFATVLGAPEDEAVIRGWIGQPLIRAFRQRSPERADELFATYVDWNNANTERLIRRYAGMDGLLADLAAAGVGLAAATSKRRGSAESALRLTGLDAYVSILVTLEDTTEHKPDPAPLLLAVERLGGRPGEAVYVGDAVVDVQAARRAGMAAVAVTWGAGTRDDVVAAEPDVVADTVEELRSALLV
jgi:pyrophosphatase PpaX